MSLSDYALLSGALMLPLGIGWAFGYQVLAFRRIAEISMN